ncbi:MAG TPA: cupin domain-containing protein, partial [Chitinophagaceae bacterium]|nr:cupin domain-containing protein [Chitinophagaceae bacterium]HNK62164.1 cupin domain-containing protein [Chitinophagaceae bacterium]HNO55221.1 cupin domain-containing protein [Chitinophagaceae bacterium]
MERNITCESLIERYGLKRHPEGGWFRQTYQSVEKIPVNGLPARFKAARPISTAIYYLLASGDFS